MKTPTLLVCLLCCAVPTVVRADSKHPVLSAFGSYLLGKVADETIWDPLTGKPDTRELDRRLKNVENCLDGPLKLSIAQLRNQITSNTTSAEYRSYVKTALSSLQEQMEKNSNDIQAIETRLGRIEDHIGTLERTMRSNQKRAQPHPTIPSEKNGGSGGKVINVYRNWGFFIIDVGVNAGVRKYDHVVFQSTGGKTYSATVTDVNPKQATLSLPPESPTLAHVGDIVVGRPSRISK